LSCLFVFNGGLAAHNGVQALHIELGLAVVGVQTVLLLLYIGQLGVAQTEHFAVVQKGIGQPLVTGIEILHVHNVLAVAPASQLVLVLFSGCPADAAVFTDKGGLAPVGLALVVAVMELALGHQKVIMLLKDLGILLVVMDAEDVRLNMVIAAGIDAGTGGVHGFGYVVDQGNGGVKLLAATLIPGFVVGTPADDGGVVEVPVDLLDPLGQNAVNIFGIAVVQTPVRVFAPNQVAHPVSMVQEPLLEDLLMEPGTVVAHSQGKLDIVLQGLVRGGGVDAVGVEALVQDQPLEYGFAVKQELVAIQADLPQTEIAFGGVLTEGQLHIVESAVADLPKMGFGKLDSKVELIRGVLCLIAAHGLAFVEHLAGKVTAAAKLGIHGDAGVGDVGIVLDLADVALRHELQPNGLPNAGGTGVVTALRAVPPPGLLAAGDHGIPAVVHGKDADLILAFHQKVGDVKAEAYIAALVGPGQLTVDKHLALVVHSTEVDPGTALLTGQVYGALVPDTIDKVHIADAGELAFRAEGDGDGAVEGGADGVEVPLLAAAALVDLKLPLAVQIQPLGSDKLGTGIFGSWNLHIVSLLFHYCRGKCQENKWGIVFEN